MIEVRSDAINDEVGHFSNECRNSQLAKEKEKVYQKKDYGSSQKYLIKSNTAEGKSWNDTDDENSNLKSNTCDKIFFIS